MELYASNVIVWPFGTIISFDNNAT